MHPESPARFLAPRREPVACYTEYFVDRGIAQRGIAPSIGYRSPFHR
jgi:hypothetical protein